MQPGYYYHTRWDGHRWILGLVEPTTEYDAHELELITDEQVLEYLNS